MPRSEQLPVRIAQVEVRPPRVVTVVLNWNGAADTLKCLKHLAIQTWPTDILVIDNGSQDDSVAQITASIPTGCEVVALAQNVGFAEGMNVGIRLALSREADYVWLLNNDAFAEPECLERLVLAMTNTPSLGMVTPRLIEPTGMEQHAGGLMNWTTGKTGPMKSADLCGPAVWGIWLTGTAPLVRLDRIKIAGLFDQAFFAYWEDIDLCLRIFRSGGDLRAVPSAVVHHTGTNSSTGGMASPFVRFLSVRNEWLFLSKHQSRWTKPANFARFIARKIETAALLDQEGQRRSAEAILAAVVATICNRYGEPRGMVPPQVLVRIVLSHPWRIAAFINGCATLLELVLPRGEYRPRLSAEQG